MTPIFKEACESDMPFLREMLYHAVYWRTIPLGTAPSFQEALSIPGISKILDDWGSWEGDSAIIAWIDSKPAGAVWYRYWTDENNIRGHIEEGIPTLVLAVHKDYRGCGIGKGLIEELIQHGKKNSVHKISLMVSKDNHALELYKKCGFVEYADVDDSLLMLYKG